MVLARSVAWCRQTPRCAEPDALLPNRDARDIAADISWPAEVGELAGGDIIFGREKAVPEPDSTAVAGKGRWFRQGQQRGSDRKLGDLLESQVGKQGACRGIGAREDARVHRVAMQPELFHTCQHRGLIVRLTPLAKLRKVHLTKLLEQDNPLRVPHTGFQGLGKARYDDLRRTKGRVPRLPHNVSNQNVRRPLRVAVAQ